MAPNPNLQRLREAGVSIWLDTLSRELLDSGGFAELISDYGVTGATSNPTIFAKAITGSDRYDAPAAASWPRAESAICRSCSSRSRSTTSAPPPACCARPTTGSQGSDGFISFECTPDLADDTAATIAQATDLWQRLAPAERDDQGPRHGRGAARDRGADPPRRERQRHAAVLGRALRAGDRRLPARPVGAGRRGRAGGHDRLGRVVLPVAHRHQGRRAARRRIAAARPARDRQRPRRLPALPGQVRRRRLGAPAGARRPAAAAAVGQHRNQEPGLLRRALRRRS